MEEQQKEPMPKKKKRIIIISAAAAVLIIAGIVFGVLYTNYVKEQEKEVFRRSLSMSRKEKITFF